MKPIGAKPTVIYTPFPGMRQFEVGRMRQVERDRVEVEEQAAGDLRQLHHCPCGAPATWRCGNEHYCYACVPCSPSAMDEDGDPPAGYDYRPEGWEVTP